MGTKLKNAFRILKGGKISLVVSAVLMSTGMVTSASAAAGDITITDTTFKDGNDNNIYNVSEADPLSWSSNAVTFYNATVNDNILGNINNPMTSINVIATNGKTINLGTELNNQFSLTSSSRGRLLFLKRDDITNHDTVNTTINNYGNIATTSYSFSPTIQFNSIGTTFNNYGTVSAADELDSNGGVINSGSAISNYDSSLTLNNSGTINGKIESPMGGIVINNSGATINGYINVGGMDARLENSGLVNLKSIVISSNTFYGNYIRDFTNKATGTLQINLDTDGTEQGTTYTKLETSSATFEDGSTINVNVSDTSTNVGLLAGTTLTDVISTLNPITVGETLNITDNSALLKFEYIINGYENDAGNTTIDLRVLQAQTVSESINKISPKSSPTQYTNAKDAARVLDKVIDDISNHPQMQSVITKLNQLPTNEAVAQAVESTTPQSTTSTQTASNQISNNIANIVMQRQNPNFGGGFNSGDEIFEDKNLWIKPFGSIGSQANKDGMNGFDVKSYGIGMGFDGKNKNDQMLGFGLFFTDANVDMNNVSQETDIKAYSIMTYGSLPVIDNQTNFLYQVGYSLQKTESLRDVFTGDRAIANYNSKMASIDTRLVRDYQINNDLMLQPLVFATYRNFKSPSYNESGAGALNLDVEKSSSSEMLVGLGTIATYNLNLRDKLIGSINVGYDLKDDNNLISSSYEGASGVSFETQGIDNGRWSYDAGVGYEKSIDNKNSVSVNYNFQGEGKDYTNNVVSANYLLKF